MSPSHDVRVTIGEVEFGRPDLANLVTHSQINGFPSAEFSMPLDSDAARRACMTDAVVVLVDDHDLFTGHCVQAWADGERLQVRCATAPQFRTDRVAFASRVPHFTAMRMLVLDAGLKLPESDEGNFVCKSPSRTIDWDQLLDAVEAAQNCSDALRIVAETAAGVELSADEKQVLQGGLAGISQAVKQSPYASSAVDRIPPSAYRSAVWQWRAAAWRYRRGSDQHEVIVPIRNLVVPMSTVDIGDVTFMDASRTSVMQQYLTDDMDPFLRDEWGLPVLARTVVSSDDLWTARQRGREKILAALEVATFRLNFSLALWKLAEGQHAAVRFERPSGSCARLADNSFVHNRATDEYWLGPTGRAEPPDLVHLHARGGPLLEALSTTLSDSEESPFVAHIRSALHWSYRAAASESLVDRFLLRWIALETLLTAEGESSSDLVRRAPFSLVSVGGRVKPIRRELEKSWIPLRNDIVHRALHADKRLAEGTLRISFFLDATIAHAIASSSDYRTLESWLAYLDKLAISRPTGSAAHLHNRHSD